MCEDETMFGQKKIMIRSLTYLNIERDAQNSKFGKTIFFFSTHHLRLVFANANYRLAIQRERALSASVTNVDSRANYLHNNSRSRSQQINYAMCKRYRLSLACRWKISKYVHLLARESRQRSVSIRNKFYRNYSIYQNAFFLYHKYCRMTIITFTFTILVSIYTIIRYATAEYCSRRNRQVSKLVTWKITYTTNLTFITWLSLIPSWSAHSVPYGGSRNRGPVEVDDLESCRFLRIAHG